MNNTLKHALQLDPEAETITNMIILLIIIQCYADILWTRTFDNMKNNTNLNLILLM
jgi:hypothetical protein